MSPLYIHSANTLYIVKINRSLRPLHKQRARVYNPLQSECFSFTGALPYPARGLAIVTCVSLVASSLLKKVNMHTIQTRSLNMSSNCLCMCFSTMRLLLNVSCGFAMFDYYCTIHLLQFAMLYNCNTPCVSIFVSVHN